MELGDGDLQALDSQRVFCPDIDISPLCPDGIGGDDHPFQQGKGSPSINERFMKAPGSPSSALQIRYFFLPGAS